MPQFYFSKYHDNCFTKDYYLDMMRIDHIEEMELEEASPDYGNGYYFCQFHGEVGDSSDGACGKICKGYEPRNGVSGRCKHHKNTYEGNGKKITIRVSPEEFIQE